jgi:signal transduction histidine kinase
VLHELLSTRRQDILTRCEEKLRVHLPGHSQADLLGELPVVLNELILTLSRHSTHRANEGDLPFATAFGAAHGELRERMGTPLTRLVHDFGLLCDTIATMADQEATNIAGREWQVLNSMLDSAIARAISKYSDRSSGRQRQETAQEFGFFAHELRNAISGAMTGFTALRSGHVGLNSRTAEMVERSLRSTRELVEQMLVDARLASGRAIVRTRLNVRDVVCNVCASVPVERDIVVRVSIADDLQIDAEENLLTIALRNLIHNGIKFSRNGGLVETRAERSTEGTTVEVEDECGGLDETMLAELYRPFVPHRHADKRGAGLGLAITRRAVEAHGGSIGVTNIAGKGCIFRLALPDAR